MNNTRTNNINTTTSKPGKPLEPHSQPPSGRKETRQRHYRDRRETWLAVQADHLDTTPPGLEARVEAGPPQRSRHLGAQGLIPTTTERSEP